MAAVFRAIAFSMSVFVLVSVFAFKVTDANAAEAKNAENLEEQSEQKRFRLLRAAFDASNESLRTRLYCESFVQNQQDTVGKFIAWSLSFYGTGQDNSVRTQCEKRKNGETCTITFAADSKGESPWSCGLRFKFDSKTMKLDPKTLECIGTC